MGGIKQWFANRYKTSAPQINRIMDQIGQVETNNQNIEQSGGGPARGYYQFETTEGSGEFQSALKRIERVYKKNKNLGEVPSWIKEAKQHDDATKLTKDQQDSLLLANLAMKGVRGKSGYGDELIKDAVESGNAGKLWVHAHWAGPEANVDEKLEQWNRNVKIYKSDVAEIAFEAAKKKGSDQERAENAVFKEDAEATQGIDDSAKKLDEFYYAKADSEKR